MERVDKSTIISWVCLLSRVTTKARRGGGGDLVVVVDFDCHKRTWYFSGSSRPTYWKVRFWAGYALWIMALIWMNSDGVRGSRGCCLRHKAGEKVMKMEKRNNKRAGVTTLDVMAL